MRNKHVRNRWRPTLALVSILGLVSAACESDEGSEQGKGGSAATSGGASSAAGSDGMGGAEDSLANCSKGLLEPDRGEQIGLAGPGVDAATGELAPGNYLIATTYLALKPDQVEQARTLGGPVIESLFAMPGFVAFATSQSSTCVSLRTLTVWQSEEDMLAFVVSPAHRAAMSKISDISRGGSNTIAWEGGGVDATWERAATLLGRETEGDR